MPLFQVTFMNHIVETYLVEAENEDAAWETEVETVQQIEPERWDCTSCEIVDVKAVEGTSVDQYHAELKARRTRAFEQFIADLDARDA